MDALQLIQMAQAVNGRARVRTIGQQEAQTLIELVARHQHDPSVKTVRVYSLDGFVPNAYKYRADIRYFEAVRNAENEFVIRAGSTCARRAGGSGALVTINGRAA